MTYSTNVPIRLLLPFVVAVVSFAASSGAHAADAALGAPLCSILKELLPEVKSYKPEGARAQLVMAVADKFDYDAVKLRQVKAEIDQATMATCPKEREAFLGVLKMPSLSDAVS